MLSLIYEKLIVSIFLSLKALVVVVLVVVVVVVVLSAAVVVAQGVITYQPILQSQGDLLTLSHIIKSLC